MLLMSMPKPRPSLGLPALLLCLSLPLQAAEFIVTTGIDAPDQAPGDGLCRAFGLPPATGCTLRAAIMEANAQGGIHTIGLPARDYLLDEAGADEDQALTGDLDVRADIRIVNDSSDLPFINQTVGDRVFEVHPTASLSLQHVAISGGRAVTGTAPFGGAVRVWYAADLRLERSTLFGNYAVKGGAIHSWGEVRMYDSDLEHNFLVDPLPDDENHGSAIAIERTIFDSALLFIERSSLSYNGEVIFNGNLVPNSYALLAEDGAQVQLLNVSMIGNSRGAWLRNGARLLMVGTTIAANQGFGLRFDHNPDDPGFQLQVSQSVVTGNAGIAQCRSAGALFINHNVPQIQVDNLYNAASDASCGFVGISDVSLSGWPFHPTTMQHGLVRYLLPVPGRGLVDTGGNLCLADEDLRALQRPLNGSGQASALCDIGAVEFDPQNDPGLPDELLSDGFED